MAIGYLTNIDLNNNQVKDFKIDNVTSDPTGLAGEGQMIYRTDTNQMKYHTGSNNWVAFGTSGGTVTSINLGSSTSTISVSGGPITTSGTIQVNLPTSGVTAGSYTSADITVNAYGIITAASDGGAGTMSNWSLTADSGGTATISDGDTVDISGSTYITTLRSGDNVSIAHDATSRSNTTSTGAPAAGATFTAIDSVVTNSTGHVTGVNTKTVTMPADQQGVTSVATGNGISGGTITSTGTLTVGAGAGLSQSSTGLLVDYLGTDNVILSAADGVTTPITVAAGDRIMISDATDNNVKYVNISQLTAAVGGGTVTSVNVKTDGTSLNVASNSITSSGTMTMVWQGSTSQYVNGAGDLVTFPSIPTVGNGTLTVQGTGALGGSGTFTANQSGNTTISVTHDNFTDTETTDTAALSFGGTFDAYTEVTTNATGHVTGHEVTTFTLPANPNVNTTSLPVKNSGGTTQFTSTETTGVRFAGSGATSVAFAPGTQKVTISSTDNNETYTLPVASGGSNSAAIQLTAGGTGSGVKSTVTFNGTTNEIQVTESTGNNGSVTIGLPNDVTITSDLTVGDNLTLTSGNLSVTGTGSFTGQVTIPVTPTASAHAASKSYVDSTLAGSGALIFQGGYNAATNTPDLDVSPSASIKQGWTYAVTAAGNFFGEAVEDGDLLIAESDSPTALSDWTVVQNNIGVATDGATDGGTTKGIAGFDSGSFGVSTNGWVTLKPRSTSGTYGDANETVTLTVNNAGIITSASEQAIAITASQVTDFCNAVDTCVADNGVTANIGDGTAVAYQINHNLGTRNVIVSCYRNSAPYDTVMLDVERTSTNQVTLRTTTALASNAVSVIITKVT
jgi:hypothetical protein